MRRISVEAKVVKIVDDFKLAINKGSDDGITKNDIFIIFEKGEELFDPDTNQSLGFLEIPKLKMRVFNIQDKLTLLESMETQTITDRKIKKTIKKQSSGKNDIYRRLSAVGTLALGLDNNDETETIIEEAPKEQTITIKERKITENNIARKIN